MDIRKILLIALKDVRVTFSDRNLLMLMFVAPVALTAIIAAALSGFASGGDSPIKHIPVVIVNEDKGNAFVNYGTLLTDILNPKTPDAGNPLGSLISATRLTSREDAMKAVREGKYVAAILIPAEFSASLDPTKPAPTPTEITVYRDAGSPVSASVVSSVVRSLVNNLSSGTIAIYAMQGNVNTLQLATLSQNVAAQVGQELQSNPPVKLSQVSVTGEKSDPAQGFNALQYFAPSMAIFFVMFTTAGVAGSIIEEQQNWTLQRLVVSPTGRSSVLAGKLSGTYFSGLTQLGLLIVAMSVLGVLFGTRNGVWGSNVPALILLTVVTALAACGIGVLIGGLARTMSQADTISNVIVTFSGMLGGAFFPIATLGGPFELMSKLTLNYWATNAYSELARTSSLQTVLPNIVVLLIMFVVYFGIGTALFNRRLKG